MKNNQNNLTQKMDLEIHSMVDGYPQNQLDETKIKCIKQNVAEMFCFNQSCKQTNPFYCDLKKCECHNLHKKCQKGDIDFALYSIKQKIINVQDLKKSVDEIIQAEITKLSEFKESLLKIMDQQFKFIQFYKIQKKFYDLFRKQKQIQSISSQELSSLWRIISSLQKRTFNFAEIFEQKMNKLTDSLSNTCEQIMSEINVNIKNFQLNHGSLPLIEQSSIITSNENYLRLNSYFQSLSPQVKAMKLIFKASEWNFDLPSYYQVCGHLQNTVIICLTQHDKIFGGFSQINFNPEKNQIIDQGFNSTIQPQQSFLFSLTQNKKFPLNINCQVAKCYLNRKAYIQFMDSFSICNNANQKNSSYVSLKQRNYNFGNYPLERDSLLKLIGSNYGRFKVKQWEVYHIQFKEDQKKNNKND